MHTPHLLPDPIDPWSRDARADCSQLRAGCAVAIDRAWAIPAGLAPGRETLLGGGSVVRFQPSVLRVMA